LLTVPQIEALKHKDPQLYEALKRIMGGVNAVGTTNKLNLDSAIVDGSDFARVKSSALTGNAIDLSKAGVLSKGSTPCTWNGGMTYASTPSSIAWAWTGMQIFRADGTTTSVPDGSMSVTGLSAATTYYFYPYWDETAEGVGWSSGGAGSPANAQAAKTNAAAQAQALQGRVPLSQGAMVAATTASGTGGGSGGGSGNCLRDNTKVLTRERGTVEIVSCKVGDHLLGAGCGGVGRRGREAWTRIERIEVLRADVFIRLHFSNRETLEVTPHHIFTLADGSPMRAERLCLADLLVGREGRLLLSKIETVSEVSRKVTVSCKPLHEFYAGKNAPTVLTHNYTFSS
jgi:hypothetical protein